MAKSEERKKLSKKAYEGRLPELRAALVRMQVDLKTAPFPILVVIAGIEAGGKGEVVNTLNAWLDPRGVDIFAFREPTDEERERPPMWRFWRCLPERGRMAVYAGGWEGEALREDPRSAHELEVFDESLRRMARFEEQLAADGALLVKVWLNLSKAAQGARLHELESDVRTAWRVTPEDWQSHRDYERRARLTERMRRATALSGAPWHVVNAEDPRARNLDVAEHILERFRAHRRRVGRNGTGARAKGRAGTGAPAPGRTSLARRMVPLRPTGLKRLLAFPLDSRVPASAYEHKRDKWLGRLNRIVRVASQNRRSIVWVFEGWDAAGKGGAIRRLTDAIDARECRVIPVAKPTDEEKAHHYLWRFWRHAPRAGMVTIYDRSWYGRVLVERVEGFARDVEWRRAYAEINEFERELHDHGVIILKFWLHISKEEQLQRFRDREQTQYKRHKINEEDWRNRRKWGAYEVAVGDMLALTNTRPAPWHLVSAEDKRHARLEIIRASCRQIEAALEVRA